MPNFRPTATGFQTKGRFNRFFEPQTMALVMGVFVGSLIFFFVTSFILQFGMLLMFVVSVALPNCVSLYVVFFLIQGKPKDHLRDWWRSFFLGQTGAAAWDDKLPPLDL